MTTSATAPRPCSRRSTCSTARSSANACRAIGIASSCAFSRSSTNRPQPDLDLHLIVDNYATHKTPAVKRWLKRHPRFHLHFTPTSASWLNMVERFFAEITRKRIRRGVFKSVAELQNAIMDYLDNHNAAPQALRLDQDRRRNPRKSRPCETSVRITTLAAARRSSGVAFRIFSWSSSMIPKTRCQCA